MLTLVAPAFSSTLYETYYTTSELTFRFDARQWQFFRLSYIAHKSWLGKKFLQNRCLGYLGLRIGLSFSVALGRLKKCPMNSFVEGVRTIIISIIISLDFIKRTSPLLLCCDCFAVGSDKLKIILDESWWEPMSWKNSSKMKICCLELILNEWPR